MREPLATRQQNTLESEKLSNPLRYRFEGVVANPLQVNARTTIVENPIVTIRCKKRRYRY
jgi:hypothetical protein